MKLSVKELLEATQGKLLTNNKPSLLKFAVSTDTREISEENIFLPLKGVNFDGHDYINQAVNKGCRAYFIDNQRQNPVNSADFIISVDNTLDAYLKIANFIRKKLNPCVIAVTGSSGKTTTKEFIYSVLATSFKTHKSVLNHNNEIGLCETFSNMPESSQFVVVEMGMRGLGEIELLSRFSEPDIAVITNIGTAHIGRLGSLENIARAKCEITAYLKEEGILLAFEDNLIKKYCSWSGKKLFYGNDHKITKQEENLTGFIYKDEYFEIPVMGEYNVINAVVAIEIGKIAGISSDNIRKGLLNYAPVGYRGGGGRLKDNIRLIVDCYNANPDSVKASIDSVVNIYKDSEIILVLGDMDELGDYEEQLHKEVGSFIGERKIYCLVTVGEKARLIAESAKSKGGHVISFIVNSTAAEFLKNNLQKNSVVLLKASRAMKFEEIAEILQDNDSG